MGLTEVGFTMFDYMRLANANREGVRLASRGPRYDDETVIDRVVASGGMSDEGGVIEPYFDTDDNLCVSSPGFLLRMEINSRVRSGGHSQIIMKP